MPVSFKYKSPEETVLYVNGKSVDPHTEPGLTLAQSLILSDDAKRFVLAREVRVQNPFPSTRHDPARCDARLVQSPRCIPVCPFEFICRWGVVIKILIFSRLRRLCTVRLEGCGYLNQTIQHCCVDQLTRRNSQRLFGCQQP